MERTTFNEQIGTCQSALKLHAVHFTQNIEDANDLVQETIFKALRHRNLYQDGTNLNAWLFTILRNTFINNYKKNLKTKCLIYQTDELGSSHLLKSSMGNDCEKKFVNDDIFRAMNKLEPAYRIAFMRFFEGYKYYETADELQIPIGTVKTRIYIARQLLKKALKMHINTSDIVLR